MQDITIAREISIHAPHEGERRVGETVEVPDFNISIHAPHEGERLGETASTGSYFHFNPRSPRGGSDLILSSELLDKNGIFQSTLPTRGSDHVYPR